MDESNYHEKCLLILENGNFKMVDHDPTKKTKNTTNFTESEKQIITTRTLTFKPKWILCRQVGTVKVYKISENDTVDELPVRTIVSNIGSTTHDLAKYLAKLLSPPS